MTSWLGPLAEAWLAWIGDASWRAAVLGAGLWLVDPLLTRQRWPEIRHGLWLLVPLTLLVPPGVAWPWPGVLSSTSLTLPPATRPFTDHAPGALPVLLLLGWVGGVVISTSTLFSRIRRPSPAPRGGDVATERVMRLARNAVARLGLRRCPQIRIERECAGPLVRGWWRPEVVLPEAALARWSDTELEHVLCHELAHLHRGDLVVEGFVSLVTRLFWFHPVAHLAHRRAHAARELCCDATVAACVGRAYRRSLVRIAADTLLEPARGEGLGLGSSPSLTLLRLRALDRFPHGTSRMQRLAAFGALAVVACVVLPTGTAARAGRELAEARASALAATGGKPAGYSSMQARTAILRLNALEAESPSLVAPPTLPEPR